MKPEVVITGMGIINALGSTLEAQIHACTHHQTGITQSPKDTFPFGKVQLSDSELILLNHLSNNQIYSRTFLLAYYAVRQAIQSAQLTAHELSQAALFSGSSVGGMDKGERFYHQLRKQASIDSQLLQVHDVGQAAEKIASLLDIQSWVTSVSTACSSAANAIVLGTKLIQSGRTSVAIVGGSDALCQFTIDGFHSLMILSDELNTPFDQHRKGLNLGEGAGFLVLESKTHAEHRQAPLLAKISGYANTCDAYHQTASSPDGQGAYLAMNQALSMAKHPSIDYINTHGTATINNDLSESIALKRTFGAKIPDFSSTKAMTGHTLAASGGIEAIFSILSIQKQMVWPNLFWKTPIHETGLIPVQSYRPAHIQAVLSNSFGFGGNNTSLIFEKL